MPRAIPSNTFEAIVRAHFGLTQTELARYLGVSAGLVAHLEVNRRRATPAMNKRLLRLAQLLPPPEGTGPPAPAFAAPPEAPEATSMSITLPDFGPLVAGPLRKRLRQVAA